MSREKKEFTKQEKEEMLGQLKKEIYRIGIQDEPSRLKYMRMYDKEKALSPTTIMNRLDMSWKEILQQISLGKNYGRAKVRDTHNMGRPRINLSSVEKSEMIEKIISLMNDNGTKNLTETIKLLKNNKLPTFKTLERNNISWDVIRNSYENKYNKKIIHKTTWNKCSDSYLLDEVRNFISLNKIENEYDYNNIQKEAPSSTYLKKRFGLTSLGFKKMFIDNNK